MNKAEINAAINFLECELIYSLHRRPEKDPHKINVEIVLQAAQNYLELLSHRGALKGKEGELLHCPFCRKENPYVKKVWRSDYYPNGASFYHVECSRSRCGARGPSRKNNRERAIKDWDTRPTISAIDKILAGTHEVEQNK